MIPKEWVDRLRCKNGLPWSAVPWIGFKTITAISPNVYAPNEVCEDVHSDNPNPNYLAMLAHEFVHIDRQQEMGVLKWIIAYVIFRQFRVDEELIADRARMEYLVKNGLDFDINGRAEQLSSWLYLHAISYEEAWMLLARIWREIKNQKSESVKK